MEKILWAVGFLLTGLVFGLGAARFLLGSPVWLISMGADIYRSGKLGIPVNAMVHKAVVPVGEDPLDAEQAITLERHLQIKHVNQLKETGKNLEGKYRPVVPSEE